MTHACALLFVLMFQLDAFEANINPDSCQAAARSFLITCLAIDLVVVLICVALKWSMNRRLVNYWTSLLVPLIIAFTVSTALIAWNPIKNDVLLDCLGNAEFSRYVFSLAKVATLPRGIVLGGFVSAALYFVLVILLGLIGKSRKG